jgi:hypothetical protein
MFGGSEHVAPPFLTSALTEMSVQLHAPTTLSPVKRPLLTLVAVVKGQDCGAHKLLWGRPVGQRAIGNRTRMWAI